MGIKLKFPFRHNLSRTGTYYCWTNMKTRCSNSNDAAYPRYGGRGIGIDPRWMNFRAFLADMGPQPRGLTIERKNNELGYSKKNCIWATRIQQARNMRSNKRIKIGKIEKCLSEWSEDTGICSATLWLRYKKGLRGHELINPDLHKGKAQLQKTHCPKGHPYNTQNTRYTANGSRICRTCHRDCERMRRRLYGNSYK